MFKNVVVNLVAIRTKIIIENINVLSNGYDFTKKDGVIEQARVDLKNNEITAALYKYRVQLDLFSKIGE